MVFKICFSTFAAYFNRKVVIKATYRPVRRTYTILFLIMLLCIGCEWKLKSSDDEVGEEVSVERYDRIQSLYLTTGDFSALQQMNTGYPQQTRTLIEDMLRIGRVNEPDINVKFLNFYQDTTLQMIISDAEQQYANMDDINQQLTEAFGRLRQMLPGVETPMIYAQIGSLDQSIVVGDGILGISLDKYLGDNYPLYLRDEYGYTESQRQMMSRRYIVPDCLGFYLLSLYPMPPEGDASQTVRDKHMGKIQWVVNKVMNKQVFNSLYVRAMGNYVRNHKDASVDLLLKANGY